MMKNIKTVIFDLDGVLWQLDFVKFGRMIARDLNVEERYVEEFANQIPNAIKAMLKRTDVKINKSVILDAINEGIPNLSKYKVNAMMIFAIFINPNYNYSDNNPKALEVVHELHQRGYKLVVKSNWFAHVQTMNLRRYGYFPYFEQIVGIMDDYMKPNPMSVSKLVDAKKVDRFIIIGDTLEKEIKLANEIGMKSIWLNETGKEQPEDADLKPTYEVHDVLEILDVLK